MSAAVAETRSFKMHHRLLFDVIQRQAGTLSKAILECVMNSVDAGASSCNIVIDAESVEVVDDGKGFKSRNEVETFFEVFGQPHDESEGKIYGTFRMGRGQAFAFGKNMWRTGEFAMDIDVKNKGLDYQLRDNLPHHEGCFIQIMLYDQLLPTDQRSCEQDLENWVKWAPIPVYLNGKLISTDPSKGKWDYETDEAYVKLSPATGSGLAIYNLGMYVMTIPGWKYGVGGEVVSKQQVKVNFARNDIQSDCKVWAVVRTKIDEQTGVELVKKKSLNDNERQRIVDRVIGKLAGWRDVSGSRLITAVTGRQHKPDDLLGLTPVTSTRKNCRRGDCVHRQNLAFVVANETLDRFHVETVEELLSKLAELSGNYRFRDLKAVDFDTVAAHITNDHELVSDKELTVKEKIWLGLIASSQHELKVPDYRAKYRAVRIGLSPTAEGWTDADAFIAINRSFLAKRNFTTSCFGEVGSLLLHEMCHREPDLEDHDHDQGFYEDFHDHAGSLGKFAYKMTERLPSVLRSFSKEITKQQLREQDTLAKADMAIEKYQLTAADEE